MSAFNTLFTEIDPLAKFVTQRLKLSASRFALAVLLVNAIIDFGLAIPFGAFITDSGPPGLLQDVVAILFDFLLTPILCGYYLWSVTALDPIVQQLNRENVFADPTQRTDAVPYDRFKHIGQRVLYITLALSAMAAFLGLGNFLGWYPWEQNEGWLDKSSVMPWFRMPMWFLTMYALCFALFNITSTIIILRQLFEHKSLNLYPWHPDRCGGLRSISRYSLALSYAIAGLGLVFSIWTIVEIQAGTFSDAYHIWLADTMYVVLAPVVFFLPLGTAHAAMQQTKDKLLLELSRQFDQEYKQIVEDMESESKDLGGSVEKIEHLQKLYEIADSFPVWPFDVANLRRFLTVTLAPIIPAVISIGIDVITSVLSG